MKYFLTKKKENHMILSEVRDLTDKEAPEADQTISITTADRIFLTLKTFSKTYFLKLSQQEAVEEDLLTRSKIFSVFTRPFGIIRFTDG